jgi:hypothetical protein
MLWIFLKDLFSFTDDEPLNSHQVFSFYLLCGGRGKISIYFVRPTYLWYSIVR